MKEVFQHKMRDYFVLDLCQ